MNPLLGETGEFIPVKEALRRPNTTVIETIPLAVLFEMSIWLSVFFEKRWFAPSPALDGV